MEFKKKIDFNIIFIDLDGTLLNSEKKISFDDLETLRKLKEKNVISVFATGRTYYSAHQVLNDNTPFDYLIFSSGAGVLHWGNKKLIRNESFNKTDIKEIEKILRSLNVNYSVLFKIPENHLYYYYSGEKEIADFAWRNQLYHEFAIPIEENCPLTEASQFLVILDKVSDFELIKSKITNHKVIRATSPLDDKSIWLEIFPKQVSKAKGAEFLCNRLGINNEASFSLGNDYNDLDLLNWTKISYVVENAPEQIKKQYKTCTHNNDNPLTNVLSKYYI